MKMIRVLASSVAILSLAGGVATAQHAPGVRKACAADMQKFCAGVADHRAARQCLRSHMADVAPECHSAVEAARAARAARAAASAGGAPEGAPPVGAPH